MNNGKVFAVLFTFCSVALYSQNDTTEFSKLRFGGYGEILYQYMDYAADRYKAEDGAAEDSRSYISVPRAVFSFDYKFRDDLVLGTETEIEYGGTGSAMELEYEEGGEYETEVEKGGEIELEQFHITKQFSDLLNIRIGHMVVPVGQTNAHHEPTLFFTSARPEGESTILPCTWHETGVAILGRYHSLSYELMVVNGLDPNGFSSINWIQGGKQGIFETSVMTSPAVAGRVEYARVKNLRLGISGYYNKTAKNASKAEKTANIDAPVSIGSCDGQYMSDAFVVRANFVYGHLGDAKLLSQINSNLSKNTNFPRTPVAEVAVAYSLEAGYDIFSLFEIEEKLIPFVRCEYYNSAEKMEEGMSEIPINKRNVFTVGLNYFLLPNLVLKGDYSMRQLDNGNYNQENTLSFALGYNAWYVKR